MLENPSHFEAYEAYLRSRNFAEAAKILASHCIGINETTILQILTLAYIGGTNLDFSRLPKSLNSRRHKVRNALESLKTPDAPTTSKAERRTIFAGKHKPS